VETIVTIVEDVIEPLSPSQVEEHLYLSEEEQINGIQLMITAAREKAENFTGRQIVEATCKMYLGKFYHCIQLTSSPFKELVSIKYFDADNQEQTLSEDDYELNDKGLFVKVLIADLPATYKRHDAVTIEYKAGYSVFPSSIQMAMLLMIGEWYEHREDSLYNIPRASQALLAKEKIVTFY
jgi:uncharacterized phiE125 gp8 family phage protein